MDDEIRRGVLMGAPLGWAVGLAVYGGIGHLVAGTAGMIAGMVIATGFAVAGIVIILRFLRGMQDFRSQAPAWVIPVGDTDEGEVPF